MPIIPNMNNKSPAVIIIQLFCRVRTAISLLISSALLLGCIEVRQEIVLNQDGSGASTIEVLIEREWVPLVISDIEKKVKEDEGRGWQILNRSQKGKKERVTLQRAFKNVNELNEPYIEFHLNAETRNDARKSHTLQIEQFENSTFDYPVEITVKMPGAIKDTDGQLIGSNQVVWQFKGLKNGQYNFVSSSISSFGFASIKDYLDSFFDRTVLPFVSEFSITRIGTLGGKHSVINGISSDGAVVIGRSTTAKNYERAFRWQNGLMTDLGTLGGNTSAAVSVSADGKRIIGRASLPDGEQQPTLWTDAWGEKGGRYGLGSFGGKVSDASSIGDKSAFITSDGNMIIGTSPLPNGSTHHVFLSKAGGQLIDLDPNGGHRRVSSISDDGSVIAGTHRNEFGEERGFVWRQGEFIDLGPCCSNLRMPLVSADGAVVAFQRKPGGDKGNTKAMRWRDGIGQDVIDLDAFRQVYALSESGSVIVGSCGAAEQREHACWWKDGNIAAIGSLGGKSSMATAVSADGKVIAGNYRPLETSYNAGFYWTDGKMRNLGLPSTSKVGVSGISADGKVIFGSMETEGERSGFIAKHVRKAWISIPSARTTFYVGIASLALCALAGLGFSVLKAVRKRRTRHISITNEMRIYCTECGKPNNPNATFCTSCGTQLEK